MTPDTPQTFSDIVSIIIGLISSLLPVLVGAALLVFFWGLARFIMHAGSEEKIKEGKQLMIWGVIALFVMVSIYGILGFLYGEFDFSNPLSFPPQLPTDMSEPHSQPNYPGGADYPARYPDQ